MTLYWFLVLYFPYFTFGELNSTTTIRLDIGKLALKNIVEVREGFIEGAALKVSNERTVRVFRGIPYAEPPLGNLRFQPPRPRHWWDNIKPALEEPPPCLHLNYYNRVIGAEDCLYMTIYTPQVVRQETYPVIVLFPPYIEELEPITPHGLMHYDVVVVIVNYRVGVLGFLSTEDEEARGNYGLQDQVAALTWIHHNIKKFQGSPACVTIIGAGKSASHVNLLHFAPAAAGLFHRSYMIGGSAMNCWSIQKNALRKAVRIASYENCASANTKEIVRCLRNISSVRLTKTEKLFQKILNFPLAPMAPVLDHQAMVETECKQSLFLQNTYLGSPYKRLKSGHFYRVPVLFSFTSSSVIASPALLTRFLKHVESEWNRYSPYILDILDTMPKTNFTKVTNFIQSVYYQPKDFIYSPINFFSKLVYDRLYAGDILRMASSMSRFTPTHLYQFAYQAQQRPLSSCLSHKYFLNSIFIDDFPFLFESPKFPTNLTFTDHHFAEVMKKMLVRFAITGVPRFNPSNEWKPLDPIKEFDRALVYTANGPSTGQYENLHNIGNIKFWESLPLNEPWRAEPRES